MYPLAPPPPAPSILLKNNAVCCYLLPRLLPSPRRQEHQLQRECDLRARRNSKRTNAQSDAYIRKSLTLEALVFSTVRTLREARPGPPGTVLNACPCGKESNLPQ